MIIKVQKIHTINSLVKYKNINNGMKINQILRGNALYSVYSSHSETCSGKILSFDF